MFDELSDQEKSVMLARLMGKAVDCNCGKPDCKFGRESQQRTGRDWFLPDVPNLYDPVNMSLAWLGLNWADTNLKGYDALDLYFWWDKGSLLSLPPEKAQRAWLDKILELAYKAGMLG